MSNHIVVGANFGDEGKGLVTDHLSSKLADNIVVRFNGGAQAAHTVELSDGRRHVFHHIGSGTLRGCPTLLSEHFIVNPLVFNREFIAVPEDNVKVFAHRRALLTTPYDWLLNQRIESARGEEQHGTTGMGINETVTRVHSSEVVDTRLEHIYDIDNLRWRLKLIRDIYVPKRAKELGIDPEYILNFSIDDYIEDCKLMSQLIVTVGNYNILKSFKNIVFEGAQGLLLDEYHYYFPHVTRSRTGIINATDILKSIGEKRADVHYVTRSYLTRHGNGPLPFEGEVEAKEDITNRPNKHQHELRFAPLNLKLLKESITNDLSNHNGIELDPTLKITWGQYKHDIIGLKDQEYGEKLSNQLFKIFPNINAHTWFYDKINESGEIRQ